MMLHRLCFAAMALSGVMIASPAFCQQSAMAPTAQAATPPEAADSDSGFMTGLRRIGVMAGEVVQCSPMADRQAQISDTMQLANEIATHFGLAAAFNFSGAVGYGAGKPFDKAGCSTASAGWNDIKQKYLSQ